MIPLPFREISKYAGLFEKCTVEPALNGLCVFDANGTFIGMIQEEGFSLNAEYKYSKMVAAELSKRSIPFWDDKTAEDLKLKTIEDLYG